MTPQQVEAGAAVVVPFQQLEAVDLTLGLAVAPGGVTAGARRPAAAPFWVRLRDPARTSHQSAMAAAHALLLSIKGRRAAPAKLQKAARTTTTKPPLPRAGPARRPETAGTPLRILFGNKEAARLLRARHHAGGRHGPIGRRARSGGVPYAIHTVLTANGMAFADPPKNRTGPTRGYPGAHIFDCVCNEHGIKHRLAKPYQPWTNGQGKRMNHTVEETTIKVFHCLNPERLGHAGDRGQGADWMLIEEQAVRPSGLLGMRRRQTSEASGCSRLFGSPPDPSCSASMMLRLDWSALLPTLSSGSRRWRRGSVG